MGLKIHKATGYGMPWNTFQKVAAFNKSDKQIDFYETFKKKFDALTDEDLTMSKEERKTRLPHSPYALEPRLLAKNVTMGGRYEADLGRADQLYQIVMTPDYVTDIIFFPNVLYGKAWHRSDDTVDYMFDVFGKDGDEPSNVTNYIRHGVYPYNKFLIDKDGNPISYEEYCLDYMEPGSDISCAVPHEICWYLTKFGFLDTADLKELRPVIAQWWC